MSRISCLWIGMFATFSVAMQSATTAAEKPIRVYILAGQSNMEGKGDLTVLEHQIDSPDRKEVFGHLKKDGEWVVRDDVWVSFLKKKGKHSIGYGHKFGPELEFGNVVGDHYDEQVLIIKCAWGGASIARKFRPPSSGEATEAMAAELAGRKKKNPDAKIEDVKELYGSFYRKMLVEVDDVLENLKKYYPDYKDQGYEIAGFVWFQGFNDAINAQRSAEYHTHMANLIRDVRKDFKKPNLPVIIGQLGHGGSDEDKKKHGKKAGKPSVVKAAQAKVAAMDEFKGNVKLVKTDVFWDWKAQKVFDKGWRQNIKEWKTVGNDYGYHYFASPYTFCKIGKAFGEAMLELEKKK